MTHTLPLTLVGIFLCWTGYCAADTSSVSAKPGHYPFMYCSVPDVQFRSKTGRFVSGHSAEAHRAKCADTATVWPVHHVSAASPDICSDRYATAHIFTFFYHAGMTNYYHLHYDTILPLFKELVHDRSLTTSRGRVLLIPSVEGGRLQKFDYDTAAFATNDSVWLELMQIFSSESVRLLPLARSSQQPPHSTLCFDIAHFGTVGYSVDDTDLLRAYGRFILERLGVPLRSEKPPRLALIARRNRRRILNEGQLVESVRDLVPADLIEFTGLSVAKQIALVQNYTIVAGVNGAGLMNCLFLRPPSSVCIQLVPYGARGRLNFETFGKLLSSRGRYLEWHNQLPENHHMPSGNSIHGADTRVDPGQFRQLIQRALGYHDGDDSRHEL